jgi:transposase
MCISLLYHTFGIRGYKYDRTEYQGGQVIFTINQGLKTCRCSACGPREVWPRGRVKRRFRALPIGSRVTTLVLPTPRVQCLACGVVRQVEIPFADPRGALQAEAHGQQPRSLSFKGALQTISRLMEQTLNGTPEYHSGHPPNLRILFFLLLTRIGRSALLTSY